MSGELIGVLVLGAFAVILSIVFFEHAQRLRRIVRSVRRGVRTHGALARTYYEESIDRDGGQAHHVFAFRTADGRRVEFEDYSMALGLNPGETLTVTYDPADPEHSATIADPRGGRVSALAVPAFVVAVSGALLLGLVVIDAAVLGLLG